MMLPLLSPVRTSPFWLNATQVTYLGFSLLSKIPIRLYSIPPLSRDQKDRCPFPQDTIWFRSSGCHSAHTTVSTEHCNWPSSFIEWTGSGFAHSRINRVFLCDRNYIFSILSRIFMIPIIYNILRNESILHNTSTLTRVFISFIEITILSNIYRYIMI